MSWKNSQVAPGATHHILGGVPLYDQRFDAVLKFREPGLAPVLRGNDAWHIRSDGSEAYKRRFTRTFGFYENRAAVIEQDDWHHIWPDGTDLYSTRYAWCGNFQGGLCVVRDFDGSYLHISSEGRPAYSSRWCYAGDFRDGIGVVHSKNGKATHIDQYGKLIHGRWFLDLDVFHKGFARARDDGGWTHVNVEGCAVYPRRFAAVEPFYNGYARVERLDGGIEIIDESGCAVQLVSACRETDLQRLSGLMTGFWKTQVVKTAADLRVIDHLPGTLEEMASKATLPKDAAHRLLRALWEIGLVERRELVWEPTEMGALLHSDSPFEMASAAQLWGREHYFAWADLGASLASGISGFERVYGQTFFSWIADKPSHLECYHRAMRGYAKHDYECLHEYIQLEGVRHVVDAGGGSGLLIENLAARYKNITATILDLPEVILSQSKSRLCNPSIHRVASDILMPWPLTADLVVFARVLHDWDDNHAQTILEQARKALEPGGRIVLVEFVLDEENPSGSLLDLNMLTMCAARERTVAEWESLAQSANLEISKIVALPRYGSLLTLVPKGEHSA